MSWGCRTFRRGARRNATFVVQWAALLLASCEYDARIAVNAPDWAPEDAGAVVPLGAAPADCADLRAPLDIAFALVDDRGDPILDGASVELDGARLLAGAGTVSARLEGAQLVPLSGGDPTPLADVDLGATEFRPGRDGVLALAVESSERASELDPGDERVRAAGLAAHAVLADPSRRLAVYAFGRGVVEQRLPPSSDDRAAADAVAAIAGLQGGDAPILDGLVAAAGAVQAASETGGSILLVAGAGEDRGSVASVETAENALAGSPGAALFAVALEDRPAVRGLACASGGTALAVATAAELAPLAVALAGAARGYWAAPLASPWDESLPAGAYRLEGTLVVTLADGAAQGERRVPLGFILDLE